MNSLFKKDVLIKVLMTVSIITIALIGIEALGNLSGDFLDKLVAAIKSVLYPFSIALILSFIVGPIAEFIDRKTFLNRTFSIIAAIVLGILMVVTVLAFTVAFIIVQLDNILSILLSSLESGTIRSIIQDILRFINDWTASIDTSELFDDLQSGDFSLGELGGFIRTALAATVNLTSSITHVVFTIVLTPVFMYFIIKDRTKIFEGIVNVFPKKAKPHLVKLGHESHTVILGYFKGHGLVMLFITIFFIVTYTILSLFIPNFTILHALLFAVVMGLFSILPYLGVWISMAMPVVLLTMLHFDRAEDTYIYLIGIAMIFILNIVEEIIESSLVQPNVFSKHVHIHPLAVLSSFIFFGGVFGLVGFILAVPIAGIIKVTFRHFRGEDIPTEPEKLSE
ncbi:MAG: AI-2E family transporter [Bacillota bacterium]